MHTDTKKTLVVGGSVKPERYSNKAILKLRRYGHPVVTIGLREGEVGGVKIQTGFPQLSGIHTVTLYVGPRNQPQYYDYLIGLKPKRIIFNPGTENSEFENLASEKGIETINHCTLIMLDEGLF
jgi:uncharacterized protein